MTAWGWRGDGSKVEQILLLQGMGVHFPALTNVDPQLQLQGIHFDLLVDLQEHLQIPTQTIAHN